MKLVYLHWLEHRLSLKQTFQVLVFPTFQQFWKKQLLTIKKKSERVFFLGNLNSAFRDSPNAYARWKLFISSSSISLFYADLNPATLISDKSSRRLVGDSRVKKKPGSFFQIVGHVAHSMQRNQLPMTSPQSPFSRQMKRLSEIFSFESGKKRTISFDSGRGDQFEPSFLLVEWQAPQVSKPSHLTFLLYIINRARTCVYSI